MTQSAYMRSALAISALELFPPSVTRNLISDRSFSAEYGLTVDAKVSLGKGDISLDRKTFFAAVQKTLTNSDKTAIVHDLVGMEWSVVATDGEDIPVVSLNRLGQSYSITNLFVLSPFSSVRLKALEKWTARMRVPASSIEKWKLILTERPLEFEEVNEFGSDINLTAVGVQQKIRAEIEGGSSEIETLVPRQANYYDRLIGKYDGSDNIATYAASAGKRHVAEVLKDKSREGLMAALLLSSHSLLVDQIHREGMTGPILEKTLRDLEIEGDYWSSLGVLELGLQQLLNEPELAPLLARVASKLIEEEVTGVTNRYHLLSALFVLVDGELSRTKLLADKPPFWRRLAALAQAALIERQLIAVDFDFAPFVKWAIQSRGQYFYMQSLIDLRLEPRWVPDFNSANQLKDEFVGRVVAVAKKNREAMQEGELLELMLGSSEKSFESQLRFPFAYFPGPLEGGTTPNTDLPDEIKNDILEKMEADTISVASFISLVNSASVFKIDTSFADLAAKALRDANYRLRRGEANSDWFVLIAGLANVAASTRNTELAEDVWRLGRRWRQMTVQGTKSCRSEDLLRIGLVAAAAHSLLDEWCKKVGDWLTELAFQEEDKEEAERLLSHIKILFEIVPQLWVTGGKAEAALRAYLGQ